jgi:hypothetical protein
MEADISGGNRSQADQAWRLPSAIDGCHVPRYLKSLKGTQRRESRIRDAHVDALA